jgi:hypothetical protein
MRHDMFSVPLDEIAGIVGRSPMAARQIASRARRRVQGTPTVPEVDFSRQRKWLLRICNFSFDVKLLDNAARLLIGVGYGEHGLLSEGPSYHL